MSWSDKSSSPPKIFGGLAFGVGALKPLVAVSEFLLGDSGVAVLVGGFLFKAGHLLDSAAHGIDRSDERRSDELRSATCGGFFVSKAILFEII